MEALPRPDEPPRRDDVRIGRAIEELRPALHGYVRSLLLHADATDDVVQETCLFLWERRDKIDPEHLRPTAFKTAWFKALSHRRDRQRERLVHFSEEALHRLAGAAEEIAERTDERLHALRSCLSKLPPADLNLLRVKYLDRTSLTRHAKEMNCHPNRLQKAISRLRLALRHCIQSTLSPHP